MVEDLLDWVVIDCDLVLFLCLRHLLGHLVVVGVYVLGRGHLLHLNVTVDWILGLVDCRVHLVLRLSVGVGRHAHVLGLAVSRVHLVLGLSVGVGRQAHVLGLAVRRLRGHHANVRNLAGHLLGIWVGWGHSDVLLLRINIRLGVVIVRLLGIRVNSLAVRVFRNHIIFNLNYKSL